MTDAGAERPIWKTFALWALVCALAAVVLFGGALGAGIAAPALPGPQPDQLAVLYYPLLASPPAAVVLIGAWVLISFSVRRREDGRLRTYRFAATGIAIIMSLIVAFLLFAWFATA
ncbi:hypothetical protein [Gryllotalpicola koreensis]|uniref:Uncharacterized protein n=1 Tax=Gryllotalpicola koreensis TaxID=993086 RepID=A0ABP8A167_9MICO